MTLQNADDNTEKGLSCQTNENSNLLAWDLRKRLTLCTPLCFANIPGDGVVTVPAQLLTGHAN